MRFTGTDKNIIYIDAKTKREKSEKHAIFDEAHFTSTYNDPIPPTALALRDAGYSEQIKSNDNSDSDDIIKVKLLTSNARLPTKGSPYSAGWDIYSPIDYSIPPFTTQIIPSNIAIECPNGTYARIASRSGLTAKHGINVRAGVIDADYRGDIGIILHNDSNSPFHIQKGDKIAQIIIEKIC